MLRLALLAAVMSLGACGGGADSVECAVQNTEFFFCSPELDLSYRCPAGSAADVKVNADIDAACLAQGGSDSAAVAQCMLKAKYKMAPAQLAEDCAAKGQTCDWAGEGHCVDKQ